MNFEGTRKCHILSVQLGAGCCGGGRGRFPSPGNALPLGVGLGATKKTGKRDPFATCVPRITSPCAAPVGLEAFLRWGKKALAGQEEHRLQREEYKTK